MRLVLCIRPETKRTNPGQDEDIVTDIRGPNPLQIQYAWDDLGLAVICLSSLEISGSLRNMSQHSVIVNLKGVDH